MAKKRKWKKRKKPPPKKHKPRKEKKPKKPKKPKKGEIMAAHYFSENARRSNPIDTHSLGEVMVSSGYYDLVAEPDPVDMFFLAVLPANCLPVESIFRWGEISASMNSVGITLPYAIVDYSQPGDFYPIPDHYLNFDGPYDFTSQGSTMMGRAKTPAAFIARCTPLPYDVYIGFWNSAPWSNFIPGRISLDLYFRAAEETDRL